MAAVLRRGVDVRQRAPRSPRWRRAPGRPRRAPRRAAAPVSHASIRSRRSPSWPDPEEHDARVGDAPARVEAERRARAGQREVAVPARHLLERPAGARRQHRHPHLGQHLGGLQCGGQIGQEEVVGGDACARRRIRRRAARRRAAAPAPGTPRPGRRAPSSRRPCRGCGSADARPAGRRVQQRLAPAHQRRLFDGALAGHRADREPAVLLADVLQLRDPVEVDQQLGARERMLSSGIRLWPPARILASPSRAARAATPPRRASRGRRTRSGRASCEHLRRAASRARRLPIAGHGL